VAALVCLFLVVRKARSARAAEIAARLAAAEQARVSEQLLRTNASALVETWWPSLTPDQKPDLQKILDDAKELTARGQCDEALGRHIWYYNHALETADPYQRMVRRSPLFMDWAELSRRCPKARAALIEIRDRDNQQFAQGNGYFDLFMEVSSINRYLQQDDETIALFKRIQPDKDLAERCFSMVAPLLVQRGEYELCMRYIGNPEGALEGYRESWKRTTDLENRTAALHQQQLDRMQAMRKTNSLTPALAVHALPGPPKTADKTFVNQTCQLIETLVGTGKKDQAEGIQAEALAMLDDARLKSAVKDAEARIALRSGPQQRNQTNTGQ